MAASDENNGNIMDEREEIVFNKEKGRSRLFEKKGYNFFFIMPVMLVKKMRGRTSEIFKTYVFMNH
jgi:hypothetical protein